MQFNREGTGEIHFQRKVPRKFQDGFADAKRRKKDQSKYLPEGKSDGEPDQSFTDDQSVTTEGSISGRESGGTSAEANGLRRRH